MKTIEITRRLGENMEKTTGRQRGFTLTELLIVLVIGIVLSTIAISQFRGATTDLERQRIVREFKIYLERARFDSVKRRAATPATMARVVLNGPTSFEALLDQDADGVLRTNETRVVNFGDRSRTQIMVTGDLHYPITLLFNQRGHVIATDVFDAPVEPLFRICSDCGDTTPDETVLSVSESGTVAILRSGQSPSTLPTPSTNSNTQPSLNCHILVAANSGCGLN